MILRGELSSRRRFPLLQSLAAARFGRRRVLRLSQRGGSLCAATTRSPISQKGARRRGRTNSCSLSTTRSTYSQPMSIARFSRPIRSAMRHNSLGSVRGASPAGKRSRPIRRHGLSLEDGFTCSVPRKASLILAGIPEVLPARRTPLGVNCRQPSKLSGPTVQIFEDWTQSSRGARGGGTENHNLHC